MVSTRASIKLEYNVSEQDNLDFIYDLKRLGLAKAVLNKEWRVRVKKMIVEKPVVCTVCNIKSFCASCAYAKL